MMLYETYFYWSGVLLNAGAAIFIALCLWVWFIWPMIEALSIARCYMAVMGSKSPKGIKSMIKIAIVYYPDLIFGRDFDALSNNKFRWEGVGKWQVFKDED